MVLMGTYYGVGHYSSESEFSMFTSSERISRRKVGAILTTLSSGFGPVLCNVCLHTLFFCFVLSCANRHIESYVQANNKHVHLALPTYKWNVVDSNVTATRVPSFRAKWNAPSGSSLPLNCYFSIWLRLNLIAFL